MERSSGGSRERSADPQATVKTPAHRDVPVEPPRDTDTIALVRPNLSKSGRPAGRGDRVVAERRSEEDRAVARAREGAADRRPTPPASRSPKPKPKPEPEPEPEPDTTAYDRPPRRAAAGAATEALPRNEPFEPMRPTTPPDRPDHGRADHARDHVQPVRNTPPVGAVRGRGGPAAAGGGRRARLRLSRVEPLSVTRLSFAFSLCVFVVLLVAVGVLWFVLNSIGVFDSVTEAADTLTEGSETDISSWLSFGRAMQVGLLIGAINVVLMTALATLGALLYNLCADMIGGLEVTLSDQ